MREMFPTSNFLIILNSEFFMLQKFGVIRYMKPTYGQIDTYSLKCVDLLLCTSNHCYCIVYLLFPGNQRSLKNINIHQINPSINQSTNQRK